MILCQQNTKCFVVRHRKIAICNAIWGGSADGGMPINRGILFPFKDKLQDIFRDLGKREREPNVVEEVTK